MKIVSTLLVDDNRTFLGEVTKFLAACIDIRIVGHALSGAEALELIAQTRPDLVLADLEMPHMNGLELTARIKALENPPQVIMLTFSTGPRHREQAIAAGADGYVCKDRVVQDLLAQIEGLFPGSTTCAAAEGAES
jgi:DNA-binding NarL/FixJ family response regulator